MGDCCLAPSPPPCETTRGNIERSQSKYVKFSYTWIINYLFGDVEDDVITSPVFPPASSSELQWNLSLQPYGSNTNYAITYMSLFLYLQPCSKLEVKAKFKFSLIDSDGRKINIKGNNEPSTFKHGKLGYGFKNYVMIVSGIGNKPNIVLMGSNKLTILCEIKVIDDFDNMWADSSNVTLFEARSSRLLENVELFESQRYTDFKIIANQEEFPVHRAILSSRSSVFLAMFEHDMEEHKQNCVEIKDTSAEVLKGMLQFIYTDKVEKIEKIAKELLVAADKYALERLKSMCEESLSTNLKITNAANMLIFADIHSANRLKKKTIEFIAERNNTTHVMATQGFTLMITSHPYLVAEILHVTTARRN